MIGWSWRASVIVSCGWLTIVGLACAVQIAAAQESITESTESRPKFDFAIGTWISTGDTRWAHDASSIAGLGNPTSKLTYKDVGTNVIELTGKVWVTPKWFGRLNVGYAGIGGGRLIDDDYLAIDGKNPSSRTHSDLTGDGMWYLNADLGKRIVEFPNSRGWLDLFAGYQYWHQRFTANGLGQVACSNAGQTVDLDPGTPGSQPLCNPNQSVSSAIQVITNTASWHSIRVGGSSEYRLTRRFSVQGTGTLIPLSIIDNEDIHHLRNDFQQNPSISMRGYGIGADADVGVRLMLIKNLFLNVGYRVWWNHAVDGTVTFHNLNSPSEEFPLAQFQSLRHGWTFGLNYTF
jgi:hypothetical protein